MSKRPRPTPHITLLYLSDVYDSSHLPYLFRHESAEPLSKRILDTLSGSVPSRRAKSRVSIPGYRKEDGDWDEKVWIPMDLYDAAVLHFDSPITIVHAWINE